VHDLVDFIAAVSLMMFVAAGLVAASLVLWMRAQRRRARQRVERTLDRLAERVALQLAAGEAPGWALERYKRLTEDARRAHTWGALQRLVWRERLLDEARAVLLSAPDRWEALRRPRQATRRAHSARH
jgi:Flp pilus assembly protein TadB